MEGQPNGGVANLPTDPGDTKGPNRTRRGLILIGSGWTLVLLGSIGVLYGGNLVWINNLEHPFVFGCLAAGLLAVGIGQLEEESWFHALTGFLSAGVMLGLMFVWGLIGVFWMSIVGTHQVASADAPGDSDYRAVVIEQVDVIDALWTVYVQQTRGPLSREWWAGCISSDVNDSSSIEDVRWQGPRQLLVTTDHSGILITVDPRTGEPHPNPVYARVAC